MGEAEGMGGTDVAWVYGASKASSVVALTGAATLGGAGKGGDKWAVPLPDATGVLCFVSE